MLRYARNDRRLVTFCNCQQLLHCLNFKPPTLNLPTPLENEISALDSLMTEDDARFIRLARLLNEALLYEFDSVLRLLYRVDVPEKRVRAALDGATEDAGTVLARLLLEREKEKAASRARYKRPGDDIPEDERW